MSTEHVAPERSNPVIWTTALVLFVALVAWWFAFMMGKGEFYAMQHPVKQPQVIAGEPEPDHAAFISQMQGGSKDLLQLGAQIYANNCTTCHGPDGGEPTAAGSRNFRAEALKNGPQPYSMYQTIAEGAVPGMPIQAQLDAEQTYAVIHYIRQEFILPHNDVAEAGPVTDAYLQEAPWPPPGGGAGGGAAPTGDDFQLTAPVAATMARRARGHEAEMAARWRLAEAAARSDGRVAQVLARLSADRRLGSLAQAVVEAATAEDEPAIAELGIRTGDAVAFPSLALLSQAELSRMASEIRAVGSAGEEEGE